MWEKCVYSYRWQTCEIKKSMNHRNYLKNKATKSRYFLEAHKQPRNRTNKIEEKAKSRHFQNDINNKSKKLKQLWKRVNFIRGKGQKTISVSTLKINEETVTGKKNVADAFNSFRECGSVAFRKLLYSLFPLPTALVKFTKW